jgi:hypothetical protein
VTHAFAADNTLGDDFAIFVYSSFTGANTHVFGVMRIDVFHRTKDPFTEEAITLWLLSTVVNGFWLCDFSVTPV